MVMEGQDEKAIARAPLQLACCTATNGPGFPHRSHEARHLASMNPALRSHSPIHVSQCALPLDCG